MVRSRRVRHHGRVARRSMPMSSRPRRTDDHGNEGAHMRIRRSFLFWGLFLVSLGAIPLLVRAGYLDAASFTELWRFWPVLLIAFGVALLLGRSAGLVGVALAGIFLGGIVCGFLAAGTTWVPTLSTSLPAG